MKLRKPIFIALIAAGLLLFQLLGPGKGITEEKVSFAVVGDISLRNSKVMAVIDEINYANPDFVIILGDFSRVAGAPSVENYLNDVNDFKESILSRFNMSVYVVAGNHEVSTQKYPRYYSLWEEAYGPFYHFFDVGSSRFIILNSEDIDNVELIKGAQLEFLRNALTSAP